MVKVEWHVQDYLHLKWHVVLRRLATPYKTNDGELAAREVKYYGHGESEVYF